MNNFNKVIIAISLVLIVIGLGILITPYKEEKKNKAFEEMALTLLDTNTEVQVENLDEMDTTDEEDIEFEEGIIDEQPNANIQTTPIESYIGTIRIPKINLARGFYDKTSKNNTVQKNVMILSKSSYPDEELGNVMLAAHNGNSYRSYFRRLSDLEIGDIAYIKYKNVEYKYELVNVYTQPKTGTLAIYRNNNKTVLTLITCTQNSDTLQSIYIFERI